MPTGSGGIAVYPCERPRVAVTLRGFASVSPQAGNVNTSHAFLLALLVAKVNPVGGA